MAYNTNKQYPTTVVSFIYLFLIYKLERKSTWTEWVEFSLQVRVWFRV